MKTLTHYSFFVVQIGFEEISYRVDESVGLLRVAVIVLDGADVFSSGVMERVLVLFTTHDGTALGNKTNIAIFHQIYISYDILLGL